MAFESNTVTSPSTIAGSFALGLIARYSSLFALARVHWDGLISKPGLFQEERDLGQIWRAAEVEPEHLYTSSFACNRTYMA